MSKNRGKESRITKPHHLGRSRRAPFQGMLPMILLKFKLANELGRLRHLHELCKKCRHLQNRGNLRPTIDPPTLPTSIPYTVHHGKKNR
ncbi:hypothetical protein BC938DRAFT_476429 [Jimgerdemannia flammicorona]|uniref:Uncharacterized protein n=1 Tax=Jimgerdemannia flammicorona TaxID=994334 RepID=A0A433PH61_9FUNG|nr:hypothetical protein BC938DRAFT_476429 [Jimgerdemannia flammicorona]